MTRPHPNFSRPLKQAPFLSRIILGGGIVLLILAITTLIAAS